MPAQKFVDKHSLKILNMEPAGIPQNNSHQHLMNEDDVDNVVPPLTSTNLSDSGAKRTDVQTGITKRQIVTVVVLCYVNLINYMDRYTIAGILQDVTSHFNVADDEGGLLQTAFVMSYMIFAPVFGYLGDRYSRKAIMAAGVFLWCVTTLIGSFMDSYHWFLLFRTMVGIGEASYSTIAPTIISDMFVQDMRSKMLALFYFAIPVGSGLGYIVGSETARLTGQWQNALRVTPALGFVAVLLILFVMTDPERGESEGRTHLSTTSWSRDIKLLVSNPSFMFSTAGFTCVSFVAGALAWWGPQFIYLGFRLQPGKQDIKLSDVSFIFGVITMISGLIGVPLGSYLAQRLRVNHPRADAYICACGLLGSAPVLFAASMYTTHNAVICYFLIFVGEVLLNMNWSIVADILLYVVAPTRRSTAEAFQILISHMFGDAGSPYLIGVISELLKSSLSAGSTAAVLSTGLTEPSYEVQFHSLQYALFTTNFVEVLGGLFFLFTALYIVQDKENAERELAGKLYEERYRPVVETPLLYITDLNDSIKSHAFQGQDNPGLPTHIYADDPALSQSVAELMS